ncbi:MAG: ROK family protein [Saprospiraceae bacterium]|nr:ROK family protein [Saprospiraceae bacterium]
MITIGADLGGTMIKLGLIDSGELVATTKLISQAEKSLNDQLPALEQGINGLLSSYGISGSDLKAIGIALPGVVDPVQKRMVSNYNKFSDANDIDLAGWARKVWDVSLSMNNDARAALWGEYKYGAGIGVEDLAIMTLGTGIGSAAISGGQLLQGANHLAANLYGHTIINFDGAVCNCGARGCAESEASGWAVHDRYKHHPARTNSSLGQGEITYRRVFAEAEEEDEFSLMIRDHALRVWAVTAFNIAHSADPKVLLIGGGIANSAEVIVPYIQNYLDEYTWHAEGATEVRSARDVDFAGAIGMADLAHREAGL